MAHSPSATELALIAAPILAAYVIEDLRIGTTPAKTGSQDDIDHAIKRAQNLWASANRATGG